MRKPSRHNIRGKKWTLVWRAIRNEDGYCEYDDKTICVGTQLKGLPQLVVLVHEVLHACDRDLSEWAVLEISDSIGGVLWDLGWRPSDAGV